MRWNWDCKLWANWNASSNPAKMLRLPVGSLVEMGGPGEAARSGRSAAKGRGCRSYGGKSIAVFDKNGKPLTPPDGITFDGKLGLMQGVIITPSGDVWVVGSRRIR